MCETELKQDLKNGLSTRKIAEKYSKSQTNVRYWLQKYGLRSRLRGGPETKFTKCYCEFCGEKCPEKFYRRFKTICRKCQNKKRTEEFVAKKKFAIQFFGGACVRCGYSGYYGAFDFHHRDPKEKELNPVKVLKRRWERAYEELKKCDLLCSNCHREHHGGYVPSRPKYTGEKSAV